jgi:hypothetical protein
MRRLALLIIALFIATLSFAEPATQENPNHKPAQTQSHNSINPSANINPLQVKIIAYPKDEKAEKIAEEERQEKHKINQTAFYLSVITLVTTIITIILLTIQIRVYAHQAKSMRRTLEHMENTERPYIFIYEVIIKPIPDTWILNFKFKNFGKTPAIIQKCIAQVINKEKLPSTPDYRDTQKILHSQTLASDKTCITGIIGPPANKNPNIAPVYIVFGRIIYKDLTGKPHKTGFAVEVYSTKPPRSIPYNNPKYEYHD